MSRAYSSQTLTRHRDWSPGRVIRAASASGGGPDRLAENANSIYAAWSPTLWSQECWDADGTHPLTWVNAAPLVDVLAFRFRCLGDAIHVSGGGIQADVLAWTSAVGPTTADVNLRTINGAGSSSAAVSGSSAAWFSTAAAVQYAQDANDREIAIISVDRTAGAQTCSLQGVHLYYNPYSGGAGALPSGVEPSGFFAHDTAQYDSQSPLSAGALKALDESHATLRTMFPWPVAGFAVDLRGLADPKAIPGGVQVVYQTQVWRIPYWRRRGERAKTLAYSILGAHEAAGDGGSVELVARVGGRGGAELDTTGTLALPIAPDPTDLADWHDGTLDISGGPVVGTPRNGRSDPSLTPNAEQIIWIECYVWSTTAGQGSGIFSLCIQEDPY